MPCCPNREKVYRTPTGIFQKLHLQGEAGNGQRLLKRSDSLRMTESALPRILTPEKHINRKTGKSQIKSVLPWLRSHATSLALLTVLGMLDVNFGQSSIKGL